MTADVPRPDLPDETPTPVTAAPILGAERIEALDVLRGLSVLGILLMNIGYFAAPSAEYMNPAVRGIPQGLNLIALMFTDLLANTKFITLFSLLFGVGIAVFSERLTARGRKPAGLHYRRMWWLWFIGMIHAYVFWSGDILVSYAVCGMVVYLLRNARVRTLMILGCIMIIAPSITIGGFGAAMPHLPDEIHTQMVAEWQPAIEDIEAEVEVFRGGWLGQMPMRAEHTIAMQTVVHIVFVAWRSGGLMLLGMAFLRLGIVTAQRSARFYTIMAAVGLGLGAPLVGWGMWANFQHQWSMDFSMMTGTMFNYFGSLGMAAGYLALVMLLTKSGAMAGLRHHLAAAGRMAFSNYLGQTLICTTLFYGHGFGLFDRLERWQLFLLVLVIWALQLLVSPWWLTRFRFGPMEWAWRSLTYWQRQPFSRDAG